MFSKAKNGCVAWAEVLLTAMCVCMIEMLWSFFGLKRAENCSYSSKNYVANDNLPILAPHQAENAQNPQAVMEGHISHQNAKRSAICGFGFLTRPQIPMIKYLWKRSLWLCRIWILCCSNCSMKVSACQDTTEVIFMAQNLLTFISPGKNKINNPLFCVVPTMELDTAFSHWAKDT